MFARIYLKIRLAVLVTPAPPHLAEPFWPLVHGEPRVPLPALTEFLVLLLARGRLFELSLVEREPLTHCDPDGPLGWLYQQLFVAPDTDKGRRLADLARAGDHRPRRSLWRCRGIPSRSASSRGARGPRGIGAEAEWRRPPPSLLR